MLKTTLFCLSNSFFFFIQVLSHLSLSLSEQLNSKSDPSSITLTSTPKIRPILWNEKLDGGGRDNEVPGDGGGSVAVCGGGKGEIDELESPAEVEKGRRYGRGEEDAGSGVVTGSGRLDGGGAVVLVAGAGGSSSLEREREREREEYRNIKNKNEYMNIKFWFSSY